MQSEKIVELDNTKTYTTVVKKINGSNSKNVSVSLQKNVNTVAEAVTISPSSTGDYKSFTESDGLYRGWIYIPAETICNDLELEIMVLEGNYNLGNAPIYEKYGQTPSIEYKSSVEGITGNVNLIVKNNDNTKNQEVTLSLGDKTLYKGDKILRKNGKWYFSYAWKIINDFSNLVAEGTSLEGKKRAWLSLNNNFKLTDKNLYKNGGMSNITQLAQSGQTYSGQEGFTVGIIGSGKRLYIYLEELSEIQTSQEFRESLTEIGTYFVLPLEEPEFKPIEDVNLINQLDKLLRMKQCEEVTNIDFDQDVIFEIDIDKSQIRVLKETNIAQNIEIEKLKEDINNKDKIISGLQGGQVEEVGEGDNISIHNCLELPIKFDKIYGKEIQVESNFVELEYIESTGSQYIDTGVEATGRTTIDIDIEDIPILSSQYKMLIGIRDSTKSFTFCIKEDGTFGGDYMLLSSFNILNKTFDWTKRNRIRTELKNNKYKLYINDVEEKEFDIRDFIFDKSMTLFAFRNAEGKVEIRNSKFKIYKFKIYEDGEMIRNFIPAKRISDSKVGMYDIVNNIFYTNQGTGKFVAGKELLLLNNLDWVEGNQEILHTNENLIDIKPYLYHLVNSNNISIDVIGNDIILNGTPTTNYVNLSKAIDVTDLLVDGEKYTLYRENDYSAYLQVSAQKYDNTYVHYALNTSNVNYTTFTIDKSTYKRYTIALQLNVINAVGTLNNYVVKSMLIRGNEIPQKYVYNKSKTFELTNLPALYSEDDYIYYDEISKKYLERNEWNKYILTGNESITVGVSPDENLTRIEIRNAMNDHEIHNNLSAICNFATVSNDIKSGNIRFGVAENANTLVYYINKNIFPTTTVFKNFIKQKYESGNPLYVIYKTENPTEKEIPDPVLIEQLDKIRAIFTYKGTNHFIITSENGQSANLKLIAYKDGIKILNDKLDELLNNNTISKQNEEEFIL